MHSSAKVVNVAVAQDDRDTVVTLIMNSEWGGDSVIAQGRARRKKGDPRNSQLGLALATGRAFQELADNEAALAEAMLNPPPRPKGESSPDEAPSIPVDGEPESSWTRLVRMLRL